MKSVTVKILSLRKGDAVPPRAGDTPLTEEEENTVLDAVESISPEPAEENAPEATELTTCATLEKDGSGRIYIRYKESELSGMEGTTTTLTFLPREPGIFTILREGTVQSTLVLEKGRFHEGLYETPVMPLDITTVTYALENGITEEGGVLFADYSLRIGGITTARTKLTVEVFPHG